MATLRDRALRAHRFVVDTVRHLEWLPPLLARLTLGVVFAQSGWGKLGNLPQVARFFASLGIPQPEFQAAFVSWTELVCGWLLLVGLFSRIAAVPLVVTMVVAIITAKADALRHYGDLFGFTEWTYLVLAVVVTVHGPGSVSLDALLTRLWNLGPSARAEERRLTRTLGRALTASFAAAMLIVTAWWFGASHNPCDQVMDPRFEELVKTSQGEGDEASQARNVCKRILAWQAEGKDPAVELETKAEAEEEGEEEPEPEPEAEAADAGIGAGTGAGMDAGAP